MPKQKPNLIRYYADGWRYGYLVRAGRKWAIVRRILPKHSTRRERVRVAVADLREVA